MSASPISASRLGTKLEIHHGVTTSQSNTKGLGAGSDVPHKTASIPRCLRADGGTLCECRRAGLRVADNVCPRIAWLVTTGQMLDNSAKVPRPYLRPSPFPNKALTDQA